MNRRQSIEYLGALLAIPVLTMGSKFFKPEPKHTGICIQTRGKLFELAEGENKTVVFNEIKSSEYTPLLITPGKE